MGNSEAQTLDVGLVEWAGYRVHAVKPAQLFRALSLGPLLTSKT